MSSCTGLSYEYVAWLCLHCGSRQPPFLTCLASYPFCFLVVSTSYSASLSRALPPIPQSLSISMTYTHREYGAGGRGGGGRGRGASACDVPLLPLSMPPTWSTWVASTYWLLVAMPLSLWDSSFIPFGYTPRSWVSGSHHFLLKFNLNTLFI